MFTTYSLNTSDARGVGSSPRITTSGAYIGSFLLAEVKETDSGAVMLNLHFTDEQKRTAQISMCIFDKQGQPTFQKPILDALMTVMKVREIHVTPKEIETRDGGRRTCKAVQELMGKPIGLVLQNRPEEWEKNGEVRVSDRLHIRTPFEVGTNLNAKEILDRKTEAAAVPAILANLRDAPIKKLKDSNTGFENANRAFAEAATTADSDDFPF